jgi:hypothetical protein
MFFALHVHFCCYLVFHSSIQFLLLFIMFHFSCQFLVLLMILSLFMCVLDEIYNVFHFSISLRRQSRGPFHLPEHLRDGGCQVEVGHWKAADNLPIHFLMLFSSLFALHLSLCCYVQFVLLVLFIFAAIYNVFRSSCQFCCHLQWLSLFSSILAANQKFVSLYHSSCAFWLLLTMFSTPLHTFVVCVLTWGIFKIASWWEHVLRWSFSPCSQPYAVLSKAVFFLKDTPWDISSLWTLCCQSYTVFSREMFFQ